MSTVMELQGDASRKRQASGSSSQRRSSSPLASRRRVAQHQDPDFFFPVLADAGCVVLGPDGPLLVCRDTHQVQHQLEQQLKSNPGTLAEKFLAGLQSHVSDDDNLRRILLPISGSGKGNIGTCDSLARVLLSVAPLQTGVANMLLEKLPEHVGDVEARSSGSLPPLMESTARLILSQFRWLDQLVDSTSLTKKLVEVVSICPTGLKKEIITFLPEIVVDRDHQMLMESLQGLLEEDSQLITAVMEACSNLNLSEELQEQVIALGLASLRSSNVEDLPILVRFLLQSGSGVHVKQVVQQLRNNLHFVTVSDVRAPKPDRKQKGKSGTADCEALVLDAIRTGLRFQNVICEAFLKEIKGICGDQNHKVVDIWILLIVHANGGVHRKAVEQLLVKKVNNNEVAHTLLRQCIQGRGPSVRDYFRTILAICEVFVRSPEDISRLFGVQSYVLLFEEFADAYHRQEVLGSLITHTGSGVEHEVGAALDALLLLATKYPRELLPISSFINGILDYLECFKDAHLHQVYQIFSRLAVTAWSPGCSSSGSSIADELLIIIRKQITNPEPRYQRMGVIGAVGLVASLGQPLSRGGPSLNDDEIPPATIEEAVSILQMTLETCKTSSVLRGFFYDELTAQVEKGVLHVGIVEWVSKHTTEFETLFLGDMDGGLIQGTYPECGFLEGAIWMNLDGDASPIILNFLPLLASDDRRPSHVSSTQPLLSLCSNFCLLASVESFTHRGSLGSIDALLGCPLHLPKHGLLRGEEWKMLSRRQKEISCFALYFAVNWIKELMNVFSSQLAGQAESVTPATRDDIPVKLHKRLRNIIYLEHLLDECLKAVPYLSFPELHSFSESAVPNDSKMLQAKNGLMKPDTTKAGKKVGRKAKAGGDDNVTQNGTCGKSQGKGKSKQPDEAAGMNTQEQGHQTSTHASQPQLAPALHKAEGGGGVYSGLCEAQTWKYRPLNISSIGILCSFQDSDKSCCHDPEAQLPLALYLLRDLDHKLELCLVRHARRQAPWITASTPRRGPSGLGSMLDVHLLEKLQPLFPRLRSHLDHAVGLILSESSGTDACDHWVTESVAAGNPECDSFNPANPETAEAVFIMILRCLNKILTYPRLATVENWTVLKSLLHAFSSVEGAKQIFDDIMIPPPPPDGLEYLVCCTFAYLYELCESASKTSFSIATESVLVLKALIDCVKVCLEGGGDSRRRQSISVRIPALLPYLRTRLSASAGAVLKQAWDEDEQGKGSKTRGDLLQQLLRMHIQNDEYPLDILEDFACNVMPQVASKGGRAGLPAYPSLSPTTFLVWYRVQHEEVLAILGKGVKEILTKAKERPSLTKEIVLKLLKRVQQCIKLHVSLVNLTKLHNKTPVHTVAVKSGGKFVDTFLKVMDFLRAQYEGHKDVINVLVKELQKATRIIQTLCSEAKGQKKMPVTCKVPFVKRSMERYVFCVKALLHGTSHGDSFWMGNLRHKDLQGREVGSQLTTSDEEPEDDQLDLDDDEEEHGDNDGHDGVASEDGSEEPTF